MRDSSCRPVLRHPLARVARRRAHVIQDFLRCSRDSSSVGWLLLQEEAVSAFWTGISLIFVGLGFFIGFLMGYRVRDLEP